MTTPSPPDAARVSAAIICLDEAARIEGCVESVAWCDEVLVVDAGSSDDTVERARRLGARVEHNPWPGYVAQKNHALGLATGEWVLSLDADERCTPELRDAILRELEHPGDTAGFEVRRHTWYLGRWIDHSGWYPDRKLRLVRRGRARWVGDDPHDRLEVDGPVRRIEADVVHFTYRDVSHQIDTVQRYSDIVAERWAESERPFRPWMAVLHPPFKFLECWVWKRGFLDGWPGFVIAVTSAFYVFTKHVKMWERRQSPDALTRRT